MSRVHASHQRRLVTGIVVTGAVVLPLVVALSAWGWLEQSLGAPWTALVLMVLTQAALGLAWLLTERRGRSTAPLQVVDSALHQLLKIRRSGRLMPLICRVLVRALHPAHATIFLWDPQTKTYQLAASCGPARPTAIQQFDESSLLIRWLGEHRKPLRASDADERPVSAPEHERKTTQASPQRRLGFVLQNLQAALVVPSFKKKQLRGFVVLGARANHQSYTETDIAALHQLATGCAVALENARIFETLRTAADKLGTTRNLLLDQHRMADAGRLAMGLAHEIKNPLTGIKTYTEFLLEKYDDPKFREDFVRIVPAEVGRINRIVQSLQDFAKPPALKLQAVDVQQILADTVSLLSNECLKRGVQVAKQFESEPIYLTADPAALKQAFLNLCLNALDAMDAGGTLSVSTRLEDSDLLVRISDTGKGMSQEQMATLFRPFASTKQTGMGLGLTVVKQIVDQHLGIITVDSNVGYGTTFQIRLPHAVRLKTADGKPGGVTAPSEPARKLVAPIRVLLVEDEPRIQEVLRERLEGLGARVSAVASSQHALTLMATEPQELVVLDVKPGDTHGLTTITDFKQRYPMTAIIAITGMPDDHAEAYARSLGALACLDSPLELARLQELAYQVAARSCPPVAS